MACPAIITGDVFLTRVIAHLDCQAQVIGSYGYQALAQPGSPAAAFATFSLTMFVALFGIRLLFGPPAGMRDLVYGVVKMGVVLSLVFSWPAFRTVIYDVVVDGPAEVAAVISAPDMAQGRGLIARLQGVDNGIVQLIEAGTGRSSGAQLNAAGPGATFAGTSLQDDAAFGWSRLLFLAGTMGSVGLVRLLAGLLLALAPLMAGLLLFDATRGIFAGWLRGLVLAVLASLGTTVVLGVQLAVLEPWLADALKVRALGYSAPATPIELFAMTLAFAVVQFAMIALLARVAFYRGWLTLPAFPMPDWAPQAPPIQHAVAGPATDYPVSRAQRIADSVETQMRREEHSETRRLTLRGDERDNPGTDRQTGPSGDDAARTAGPQRLGESFRRTQQRSSTASRSRDSL